MFMPSIQATHKTETFENTANTHVCFQNGFINHDSNSSTMSSVQQISGVILWSFIIIVFPVYFCN